MRTVFAGIDAGSSAAKAVLIDAVGGLLGSAAVPTGIQFRRAAEAALTEALNAAGRSAGDIAATVSCGYGRKNIDFADSVRTEIACLAEGVHHFFQESLLVLDIGGRDIKTVRVGPSGEINDFKMNAQCAAGTGAFLEDIAARIQIPLDALDIAAQSASSAYPIGSHCTVFAAGEVLSAARSGAPVENIVLGIYHAMVKRVLEMIPIGENLVITGGVIAHHAIVGRLLSDAGLKVRIAPYPQLTGAFGAALFAKHLHTEK